MPILHITNGDSAADAMREAGTQGEILPWRDVLHEGPVPAGLGLEELSAERARFIEGGGLGAEHEVAAEFAARDRRLRAFREDDEVVLWFEHDLYDQLQLIQLLDFFAGADVGSTRLTLVNEAEYLGPARPERIAEMFAARRAVTAEQLDLGRRAWLAFRSPEPTQIERVMESDTAALPFLAAALRRHLEQFPGARDGLSRSERQALQVLSMGPMAVGEAYRASHHDQEEAVFLGDVVFTSYLHDLSPADDPLVTFEDGTPVVAPPGPRDTAEFFARRVVLTDAGREVLAGRADRVARIGIDRWLGGVHLHGREAAWRWDAEAGRLVSG